MNESPQLSDIHDASAAPKRSRRYVKVLRLGAAVALVVSAAIYWFSDPRLPEIRFTGFEERYGQQFAIYDVSNPSRVPYRYFLYQSGFRRLNGEQTWVDEPLGDCALSIPYEPVIIPPRESVEHMVLHRSELPSQPFAIGLRVIRGTGRLQNLISRITGFQGGITMKDLWPDDLDPLPSTVIWSAFVPDE